MPLSININLPRDHTARYPSRCICCGDDPKGHTVLLWAHTIGWWTLISLFFGKGFTTRPPACSRCSWRIRAQRWGGVALTVVVTLLILALVWPQVEASVPRSLERWAKVGLVLFCLVPYVLWAVLNPQAIDITAYEDSVDYEFKDAGYAKEFAALNSDAEWVRIS